ncbi:hypothetical protein [Streptomyces halobius]|uniref:Uncharacterized protein n=1 Tax=Streptomyces halobius TaxID=2879846 RepID=A0ABY4MIB8_9ACTN|nr:hypothetical protein [Streptomyces halobius]UQA97554.1 hypothetical protein K9S39_41945 [Streptomyces halobius]
MITDLRPWGQTGVAVGSVRADGLTQAKSGYVNVVHCSVLGPEVADVTIGHGAVLRTREQ